jgi:hypothetical protein
MWDPQPLTTLRASKACRGENFTFTLHRFSAVWAKVMLKHLLKCLVAAENPVILITTRIIIERKTHMPLLPVPYYAMAMHIYPDIYLFLLLENCCK